MPNLNIPPIREPFFDAYVEIRQGVRLEVKFKQTSRPWAQWATNLSKQTADVVVSQATDDLFGSLPATPRAQIEFGVFDSPSGAPAAAPSLLRHFLLMGA